VAGLFDLLSPEDLYAKLEHDFTRVRANGSDVYAAFDFVITAWHLLEWRYPDPDGASTRSAMRNANPILELCEHLAVGGKHFAPTAKRHQSVSLTRRSSAWKRGFWAPGVWAPNTWKDDLVIELAGPAKVAFGDTMLFPDFANLVMEYWRRPGGYRMVQVSGLASCSG
jgi:hypothetical protein